MSVEKRATFVLFELEGLPCEQIAELMGVPLGTVHSRIHAARAHFKAALESDSSARSGGAMSDPERWLTALEQAPTGASKLLSAYSSAAPMPADVHARLLAKATELSVLKPLGLASLLASKPAALAIAIGVAGAGALATAPPAISSRSTPAWLAKGVESVQKLADQRPEPALPLPQPAERVVAIEELGREPPIKRESKASPAPKRAGSLADEAELVDDARRMLEWDASAALRICREHEQRFPNGQLRSTREALTMRALRKLGRSGEARKQAELLLGHDPSTLHAEEAARAVDGDPHDPE